MTFKKAPIAAKHTEPKALIVIMRIINGFQWLQVSVVLLFLITFPLWAFYVDLYFGVLITSSLGLILSSFILSGEGRWFKTRYFLLRIIYLEHSVLLLSTIICIIKPLQGEWKKESFYLLKNTTVKVFIPRPDLLLVWTEKGQIFQRDPQQHRWVGFSTSSPRASGWAVAYDPLRDWMLFGLHDNDRLNVYKYKTNEWKGFLCPKGQVRDLALEGEYLFALIDRRLYKHPYHGKRWQRVNCGGYCSGIAGNNQPQRPYLFVTGRRWMESRDGGHHWRDITPAKDLFFHSARAALGNQGTRYAYSGGFFQGHLLVAQPNQPFRRRPTPASDIRALVVHPENDHKIWLGTWGQGIFASDDTGKTWRYLGLRGVEVRSLAFFQDTLYAGSSNLVFNRGLFRLSLSTQTTVPAPPMRWMLAPIHRKPTTPLTDQKNFDTLGKTSTRPTTARNRLEYSPK